METIHAVMRQGRFRDIRPLSMLAALLRVWSQRRRQRRALSQLDSRLLADIGLTAERVREEARKPFWQA